MSKIFTKVFCVCVLSFIAMNSNSQTLEQSSTISNEFETSDLKYFKEIPSEDSYRVVKNLTKKAIKIEMLEMINFYRKVDEDYTWIVNSDIEILIYKIKK